MWWRSSQGLIFGNGWMLRSQVVPALMTLITVIITAIRSRSLPAGRGLFAVLVGLAGVALAGC